MSGNTWSLEFPYRRSVGAVVGEFLTGLRDRRILGARTASGRVLVPALEYDPVTSEPVEELVPVGEIGSVTSWVWIETPRRHQPLDRPFAYAMVRLEGADTDLLHMVDAGSADVMHDGMAVTAVWREEREGKITDIEAFVPVGEGP